MANSRRKAIIKQNRPMASDRANPRMAYEKSCCLREGFLAYPMMRDPKTDPIPAPDPATPTVAAPAPMNLAAESMSALGAEVCMACTVAGRMERMVRRGETARRAMADMMIGGCGYRLVYRSGMIRRGRAWPCRWPGMAWSQWREVSPVVQNMSRNISE